MKLSFALLAAAVMVALPTTRAGAAEPTPTPCAGVTITDPAGDQQADTIPLLNVPALMEKTEDNTDIRQIFFNTRTGEDGKTVATANIVLTNATKDIPSLSKDDAVSYVIRIPETNNVTSFKAENKSGTFTYTYRYFNEQGLATTGETKGAFFEGPMGVVQIQLPPEISALGTKLTGIYAYASITSSREEQVAWIPADTAPDDGSASTKSYTVTECPPPADPAPAPVPPAPIVEAPPAPPAPTAPAAAPAPAPAPATKSPAKKKKKKASCNSKVRKLKGKKRAKALKACKKKAKKQASKRS